MERKIIEQIQNGREIGRVDSIWMKYESNAIEMLIWRRIQYTKIEMEERRTHLY